MTFYNKANSMKILLLGPNGQLGNDIKQIHNQFYSHYELICLDRNKLDVAKTENIKPKLIDYDFDILINCISYNKTVDCETNAKQAFLINAFSVKEMASVCYETGAQLIHVSTDYVFGDTDLQKPLTESQPPAPLNVYGCSKLMGESLAQTCHENVIILRTASLYGISGANKQPPGNFVEHILQTAHSTHKLKVVTDQLMSPTASFDLAKMIFKMIEVNAPTGIYHAVNSGQVSWFEFAKEIIKNTKIDAKIEPISSATYQAKMRRPTYSVLDNSKLTNYIGNIPSWQDALYRYLAHRKAHVNSSVACKAI